MPNVFIHASDWYLELLAELGIQCRVGHPAKIRAAETRREFRQLGMSNSLCGTECLSFRRSGRLERLSGRPVSTAAERDLRRGFFFAGRKPTLHALKELSHQLLGHAFENTLADAGHHAAHLAVARNMHCSLVTGFVLQS